MSEVEFDPAIERAYRYSQPLCDSPLFDAEVELQVYKRSKWRRLVMTIAGLGGCGVLLTQIVRVDLKASFDASSLSHVVVNSDATRLDAVTQKLAANVGLGDVALGGMTGPHIMILCGVALTILLAGTAVRISQSL